MNTNSDDILLLKLIKQGDQIAFRHLFYQYADSLERFITYYIHDREKSQDLVLDIFTYIWENRQNFEIKQTLKAYLFQGHAISLLPISGTRRFRFIWKKWRVWRLCKTMIRNWSCRNFII